MVFGEIPTMHHSGLISIIELTMLVLKFLSVGKKGSSADHGQRRSVLVGLGIAVMNQSILGGVEGVLPDMTCLVVNSHG